jgi:hypothetical protein
MILNPLEAKFGCSCTQLQGRVVGFETQAVGAMPYPACLSTEPGARVNQQFLTQVFQPEICRIFIHVSGLNSGLLR